MGTDVKLADRDQGYDLTYHPNFQWGITETWFNGTFHVDTMNKVGGSPSHCQTEG